MSLTNVHAMVHKSTNADQTAPMVELCIHGGGAKKYGRGLTIADDSLPAVQRLRLVLTECFGDTDDDDDYFGEER